LKRSSQRTLTTHVGSLPRPEALIDVNRARLDGEAYDEQGYPRVLSDAVAGICRQQAECGVDVINDGEFGKATRGSIEYGSWQSYAFERLTGWEYGQEGMAPGLAIRRDRQKFADFYRDEVRMTNAPLPPAARPPIFTGPIKYRGQELIARDVANLKAALGKVKAEEAFMTAVAPGSFARRQNQHYATEEEYLFAVSEAMREEYQAIVDAGFVLQLDDPGLPDSWDMTNPEPSVEEYRKWARVRVEALNQAIRGLPEDRIRYHICWGSWHGPHTTDLPLRHIVELLLEVGAGAYSIEAGNARHEHEWKVWQETKLPDGKVLIPGVVSHATNVVEHPELVADRIVRFAGVVGRENVIAGTDCGLGGRIHPQLVWAKLQTLVDGARLASRQLWG